MIPRMLVFFLVVVALVAAGVWFADRPGHVAIDWLGWRVDTSVPILLVAVAVVVGLLMLAWNLLRLFRGMPRRFAESRRERRRQRGYLALAEGFAAVAAGDPGRAQRHAAEAQSRLKDPALTLLLSAQAADLAGDNRGARQHFEALLQRRGAELPALRGLLNQAQRAGDRAEALALAGRAHALKPDAEWAARALFEEQVLAGRWAEAEATLERSGRGRLVEHGKEPHLRAVLATARAREALSAGDAGEALRLARTAVERERTFAPAIVLTARLLAAEGKDRRAAGLIEEVWRESPHPDLAAAYLDLWPADDALKRAQRAERLAGLDPDHPESRLVAATAAVEAQLWGQARRQLVPLAGAAATVRVARLMARIEQGENGDAAAAKDWLERASVAFPDPHWRCTACGAEPEEWAARCQRCGSFDTLAWAPPPRALVPVG